MGDTCSTKFKTEYPRKAELDCSLNQAVAGTAPTSFNTAVARSSTSPLVDRWNKSQNREKVGVWPDAVDVFHYPLRPGVCRRRGARGRLPKSGLGLFEESLLNARLADGGPINGPKTPPALALRPTKSSQLWGNRLQQLSDPRRDHG
jgi:hypothetical protein